MSCYLYTCDVRDNTMMKSTEDTLKYILYLFISYITFLHTHTHTHTRARARNTQTFLYSKKFLTINYYIIIIL